MFLMKCELGGSGKSTVVKQMRILHGDQGLTPADRQVVSICHLSHHHHRDQTLKSDFKLSHYYHTDQGLKNDLNHHQQVIWIIGMDIFLATFWLPFLSSCTYPWPVTHSFTHWPPLEFENKHLSPCFSSHQQASRIVFECFPTRLLVCLKVFNFVKVFKNVWKCLNVSFPGFLCV